jgi:hypothetical protein
MISHAPDANFAICANALMASQLAGKPQGKRGSLFDAFAPPGGPRPDSPAVSSGSENAPRTQIAPAAFLESARVYRSTDHAPGRRAFSIAGPPRGPSAAICDGVGKNWPPIEAQQNSARA